MNGESCIFCPELANGNHHVLPKSVRRSMRWGATIQNKVRLNSKVPLCTECHVKFNLLLEPLICLIKALAPIPPIPIGFTALMEKARISLVGDEEESM